MPTAALNACFVSLCCIWCGVKLSRHAGSSVHTVSLHVSFMFCITLVARPCAPRAGRHTSDNSLVNSSQVVNFL